LHGVLVEGTEQAMRDEMRDVFARMRGAEGEVLRRKAMEIRKGVMQRTREPGGASFESLRQLATAL